MANNEKTSPEVAAIASEILKIKTPPIMTTELWAKIHTLAGSVLTQAPDHKMTLTEAYNAAKGRKPFSASPDKFAAFKKKFSKD